MDVGHGGPQVVPPGRRPARLQLRAPDLRIAGIGDAADRRAAERRVWRDEGGLVVRVVVVVGRQVQDQRAVEQAVLPAHLVGGELLGIEHRRGARHEAGAAGLEARRHTAIQHRVGRRIELDAGAPGPVLPVPLDVVDLRDHHAAVGVDAVLGLLVAREAQSAGEPQAVIDRIGRLSEGSVRGGDHVLVDGREKRQPGVVDALVVIAAHDPRQRLLVIGRQAQLVGGLVVEDIAADEGAAAIGGIAVVLALDGWNVGQRAEAHIKVHRQRQSVHEAVLVRLLRRGELRVGIVLEGILGGRIAQHVVSRVITAKLHAQRVRRLPEELRAGADDILVLAALVHVAIAPLVVARQAQCQRLAQRQVHRRGDAAGIVVSDAHLREAAVFAEPRGTRDHVDGAGDGIAPIQRALRPLEHLDALKIAECDERGFHERVVDAVDAE